MHFQWYPGHMTKARRMMQENIKLIDLIIELVDARVPLSSRNPDIDELGKGKARLILLNKADLAEDRLNDEWVAYFKEKGYSAVKVNSRKGGGIKSIQSVIQEACREKTERDRKRGILNRPVRAMVVGIPNVGKSTLFNAITKSQVEAANYPFATIQPNVGVVEVPDARIDRLVEIFHPKKTIYTTFEFTDIAGLVKGASKGEGLGNQFLSNIRLTDAICHVVRCFDDANITHVENSVDPVRDAEIINLELNLADLQTVENRIGKIEKKSKTTKDKDAVAEMALLNRLKPLLEEGKPARVLEVDEDEAIILKGYNLLTAKPMIYVANLDEEGVMDPSANAYYNQLVEYASSQNNEVVALCAKMEEELSELDKEHS